MLRSPLRPLLRPLLRSPTGLGSTTLVQRAIGILRKYGTNAHIFIPGVGTLSGITAGNYLDSAGVTAASVDNPVGLSLDALQAMTLGAEKITNGDGSSLAGWTTVGTSTNTIENNKIKLTAVGAPSISGGLRQDIAAVAGVWNRISIDIEVTAIASGRAQILVYDGAAFTPELFNVQKTALGTYSISGFVKPTGSTIRVYFLVAADASGTTTALFDNISVREIPGIHASQATTANKPILRRGLLNLGVYSNDQSAAGWSASAITVTNPSVTLPNGSTGACSLLTTTTAAAALHRTNRTSTTITSGSAYTSVAVVKANGYRYLYLNGAASGGFGQAAFDLVGGTVSATATGTASMLALGNGFYLCCVSGTAGAATNSLFLQINNAGVATDTAFTADGVSGIYVYQTGLFQGTLTAQQILDAGGIPLTTTAAASSPSAGKYSWQFDGSNDRLSLGAPPFQMADDHAVIAGFKRSTTALERYVFTVGAVATNVPLCAMIVCATDGTVKGYWRGDDAVIRVASSGISYADGLAKIATVRKVGNSKICRVNGISGAAENSAIGATTLDSTYIGSNSPTFPTSIDASIYPVIAIKGTVTDADLLTLERFVGQLSGVSI